MFGLRGRGVVEQRAKALGDQLFHLLGMLGSMTFEEFVDSALKQGFVESYRDPAAQEFGFFEGPSDKADMSFHVGYGPRFGERVLTSESHGDYFGLTFSGHARTRSISVDMKVGIPRRELGRDARALQAALLRFPGFTSLDQLRRRFGL